MHPAIWLCATVLHYTFLLLLVTFEPDPLHLPRTTTTIFYAPNNTGMYTTMCAIVNTSFTDFVAENEVMDLVRQRLPQIVYMSYATENEMIQSVRNWRQSNQSSSRNDTCINGYGENYFYVNVFQCRCINRRGV